MHYVCNHQTLYYVCRCALLEPHRKACVSCPKKGFTLMGTPLFHPSTKIEKNVLELESSALLKKIAGKRK